MGTTLILTVSAALSAILHTLIPDHEIPLAMIGRTQNWSLKKMTGVTLLAGVIHISVSMGIGVIALIASETLSQFIANSTQQISGLLLVAFGSVYIITSWRRKQGKHAHHHGHKQTPHSSDSAPPKPQGEKSESSSEEGWTTWITAIVGISPCFTLIPILIAAVSYGPTTTLCVMISYALATIGMMVFLTLIAFKTIEYLTELHRIEKHIETLAGTVIVAVGIWLILETVLSF